MMNSDRNRGRAVWRVTPSTHNRAQQAGFTLIELMIVVVIISLASAIAVPVYEQAIENRHRSALKADCYQLYQSLMTYQLDNDKFLYYMFLIHYNNLRILYVNNLVE